MARVLMPVTAPRLPPSFLGAYRSPVRAQVAPPSIRAQPVMSKPAMFYRGQVVAEKVYRGGAYGRGMPGTQYPYQLFGIGDGEEMSADTGGGDMTVEYNATTNTPVSTPTPAPASSGVFSSIDWSKIATAAIQAGGGIASSVIAGRNASSGGGSAPVYAPQSSGVGAKIASLVTPQNLAIGGVAIIGLFALTLLAKR